MLIRAGGGTSGAKLAHYLETGEMQGREKNRDELDHRIWLEGKLERTADIIDSIDRDGEKFMHFSLGFYEDHLPPETLQDIASDFKSFISAAYGVNELNFYAEAHIPKIQSYKDRNDKPVFRKPHIHFIVPTVNMVTGERANPFEMMTTQYGTKVSTWEMLKAFQEQTNHKYGLASPEDHKRQTLNSEMEAIASHQNKVDSPNFDGIKTKQHLLAIQERMIAERIETPEAFRAMLKTMGAVKDAKSKEFGPYLKVKLPGEAKHVRLDYYQFSKEFISLPTEEKRQLIEESRDRQAMFKRQEAGQGSATPEAIAKTLAMWPQRAREVRYLDMNTKFYKETYSKATPEQQRQILDEMEWRNFTLLKADHGYDHRTGTLTLNSSTTRSNDHAKDFADFDKFDRYAPRPDAAARRERLRELRGLDVVHEADELDLLLPGDASGHLEHAEADLDFSVRRGGNGRGGISLFPESGTEIAREAISDAALARMAAYHDALDAARAETPTDQRLSKVYGRTLDQIQEADAAGQRIIADPSLAVAGLTFSQSTFTPKELEAFLVRNTADHQQYNSALAGVMGYPDLVTRTNEAGQTVFTTAQIVKIEADLVERAEKMASHKCAAISADRQQGLIDSMTMNEGQEAAFKLLCSRDQLAVVNGSAGTGKSYILGAMRQAYEEQGYKVYGAILQGKTAEDLERDSGIKSQTMHSFLAQIERGEIKLNSKSVVVIDEAGMIASAHMEKVLGHVQKAGARIRLVGDAKQLAAVEYGRAFKEVSARAQVASLTQIQRQKQQWQREASERFSEHDIGAGLTAYAERGHVHQSDKQGAAQNAIVEEWAAAQQANPHQSMLVLVATNAERMAMNNKMRETLKDSGKLWDGIIVATANGYREFATGDRVMFGKNDRTLGTKNGTTGSIEEIKGRVLIVRTDDGRQITLDTANLAKPAKGPADIRADRSTAAEPLHLDYSYAVTVHKSQGMTVDRAWLLANPIMAAENVLVGCTRHRHELAVHYSKEHFSDLAALVKRLGHAGRKEFTFDPSRPEWDAARQQNSVIGQVVADYAAEKYIAHVSTRANFKELRDRLNADRVLDHVVKSHGVVAERYSITKDPEGRDRIQCGKQLLSVSDFLTKEMHLDFKAEALPIMKEAYARQNEGAYMALRDAGPQPIQRATPSPLWDKFTVYRAEQADANKQASAALKTEKAAARAAAKEAGLVTKIRIKASTKPAELRAKLNAHQAAQRAASKALTAEFKAKQTALASQFKKPQPEQYKDFLETEGKAGNVVAVAEFRRISLTSTDRERLAALTAEKRQAMQEDTAQARAAKEAAAAKRAAEKAAAAQQTAPETTTAETSVEKSPALETPAGKRTAQEVAIEKESTPERPAVEVAGQETAQAEKEAAALIEKMEAEQKAHELEMQQLEKQISLAKSRGQGLGR